MINSDSAVVKAMLIRADEFDLVAEVCMSFTRYYSNGIDARSAAAWALHDWDI